MQVEVIEVERDKEYERWLEVRTSGIGGSDAAAVFGHGYKSAYTLWAEKSGLVKGTFNSNAAMEWGQRLERTVAEAFAEEQGRSVVNWPVILRSKAHPVMMANVDFFIVDSGLLFPAGMVTDWTGQEPPPGIRALLEVKTTGIASYGNSDGWADGAIPIQYYLQGRHYSAVTGVPFVVFAALVGGQGLQLRGVEFAEEELHHHVERVSQFWQRVVDGAAPEPDGSTDTLETVKALYPRSEPELVVEADDFVVEAVEQYVKLKDMASQYSKEADALRARLAIAIGKGEEMRYDGRPLFTFKNNKDGTKFNVERFKEAHPDLFAEFCEPTRGARVLRLKGEK